MRIPIVYIPKTKFRKFIHIEANYTSDTAIVPLGCDCHPAYVLQKLHIRTKSLPFDWFNTNPALGLQYVNDNISNNFDLFLDGLKTNERGHVVSSHYDYAEMIHERDIIGNEQDKAKFLRRIKRFLNMLHAEPLRFLYNYPVSGLKEADVERFAASAEAFSKKIKKGDMLHVYLRFDENTDEDKEPANSLFLRLQEIPKVKTVRYVRELSRSGIWGDPAKYPGLLRNLGIPIRKKFPKIYIK